MADIIDIGSVKRLTPESVYNNGKSWNAKNDGKRILESWTRRQIEKILKKYDAFYFAPVNFGFGQDGVSDIIAVLGGIPFALEAKGSGTGHIYTAAQEAFHKRFFAKGGVTGVISPFDLDKLDDLMRLAYEKQKRMKEE